MDRLKIGVIGAGAMGRIHCDTISSIETLELTAVCDENQCQVDAVAAKHGSRAFYDYKELLKSGCCSAVLIATPHYAHTPISIEALHAGVHVLVEKPVAVQKADCERMIAAHTDQSLVFAAMFNQRTNPCYQKVKQLIGSGELGSLMRVTWIVTDWFRSQRYYDNGYWRATWNGEGGGVLLNQCPHQLDLLQWLCGMPVSVSAHCALGKYHQIEVEDEVTAFLQYANGATGVFITSTGEAPGTNRLEITGTRGKVVIEHDTIHFIRNETPSDEFCRNSGKAFASPDIWDVQIPISGKGGQHTEIIRNFADAVLNGAPLLAPAVEGIHSVELANAMLFSSATKKEVSLPLNSVVYEKFLEELCKKSSFIKQVCEGDMSGITQSF